MAKQRPTEIAEPAPGEDNNKHLAFLQAQEDSAKAALAAIGITEYEHSPLEDVIALVVDQATKLDALDDAILTTAGIELQEGQNAVDQAIAVVGRWREINLKLAEAIVAGEHDLEPGGDEGIVDAAIRILSVPAGNASAGEIAAIARAEDAETALAAEKVKAANLQHALEQMGDEGKRPGFLKRLLSRGAVPEAEAEPAAPREPVECGPTFGSAKVEEIRGFLFGDEEHLVEVVLSDGEHELVEFKPEIVGPGDLVRRGHNYLYNKPILIVGPEGGRELAGAALLVDGEQIDFCGFDRPMQLVPGEQYQLSHQFTFGS
jgi:hypothetical protein